MRAPLPSRLRARLRGRRGATVTEYALLLALVLIVAFAGVRYLGRTATDAGYGRTDKALKSGQTAQAPPPEGQPGGGGGDTAGGAAGGGGNNESSFGGARARPVQEKEDSPFVKFALIALGVIGLGATFFALTKGKHAGTG